MGTIEGVFAADTLCSKSDHAKGKLKQVRRVRHAAADKTLLSGAE
jgi:hypothetical protein